MFGNRDKEILCKLEGIELLLKIVLKREEKLMALSDDVKAALAVVSGNLDAVSANIAAAVADIQGLHAKLDELLASGDVAGAQAALVDVQAKSQALADAAAALQVVVDIPE